MQDVGKRTIGISYKDSFRRIHPFYEPVVIRGIDELPGTDPGIRVTLTSRLPFFSHFLVAIDDGGFIESDDGVVVARFDRRGGDRKKTIRLKTVSSDNSMSDEYVLEFGLSPAIDPVSGERQSCNDRFNLKMTPHIQTDAGSPDDWKYPVVTEDEKRFAASKWGSQVKPVKGDYERAKLLARILMKDLWPHSGNPSPAMRGLQPFEKYERMTSGLDKGVCMSFAAIFECACKCFDVLARQIGTCHAPVASHESLLLLNTNHATTEIYDRETGCWILMDLRFYMLGAFLGAEGPLSLAEFILFLNQPARKERLHILSYDPDTGNESLLPLAECPRSVLGCYEGWDRSYSYSRI